MRDLKNCRQKMKNYLNKIKIYILILAGNGKNLQETKVTMTKHSMPGF